MVRWLWKWCESCILAFAVTRSQTSRALKWDLVPKCLVRKQHCIKKHKRMCWWETCCFSYEWDDKIGNILSSGSMNLKANRPPHHWAVVVNNMTNIAFNFCLYNLKVNSRSCSPFSRIWETVSLFQGSLKLLCQSVVPNSLPRCCIFLHFITHLYAGHF